MAAISLLDALADVPDPRGRRGLIHPLPAVLGLAVVAVLSGCKSLEAIAQFGRDRGAPLAHALGFRRAKTPVKSRLSTLLRRLDPAALDAALARWLAGRHEAGWEAVAIDGKSIRGSRDGEAPCVHLLSAYAPQAAAVLGQLRVGAETNEHKAALRLLGILPPLRGAVVTADAMFTHRDFCAKGVERLPAARRRQPADPQGRHRRRPGRPGRPFPPTTAAGTPLSGSRPRPPTRGTAGASGGRW
jgi:hypothetical protein